MEETIKKWYELPMGLEDVRSSIRANIRTAARSFVAIGFYLKRAREDRLYEEAGFSSVWDFAREEFGISRSTATRYMAVNDRFSADGNSPNLATEYQAYNQSQLIEMVTMTGEQLEQVTPDMTVRELREMKQEDTVEPEETQIVGQMEISDFPEYMPEPAESDNLPEIVVPAIEIPLSDLAAVTAEEPEDSPEICATSHTETGVCLYRSEFRCTLKEEAKRNQGTGEDCSNHCCWDCIKRENCKIECVASETRSPEPESIVKNEIKPEIRRQYCEAFARKLLTEFNEWFLKDVRGRVSDVCNSEVELKKRFTGTWYFPDPVTDGVAHINLFTDYVQIWNRDDQCLGNAEWFYLCAAIQAMWNVIAMENTAKAQQNEKEPTDTELLHEMLEKEKSFLEDMIKVDKLEPLPSKLLRKKKILVAALAGMLCDMEEPEVPEEPEQPELPLMKNNEQRKEWLKNYQSWGLWYTDEHIGCRYYKYDFNNGARLIAEEYSDYNKLAKEECVSSYLHLVGGPEPPKHPVYRCGKWTMRQNYNRFPNSETELVEFLKELQKGEKNNGTIDNT